MTTLVGLIGVYHADGGVRGELAYVVGKLLGRTHCDLCDITHAGVRRRPEWDAMVLRLGVAFELVHLNELEPAVAELVEVHGSPVVLARLDDGSIELALGPSQLALVATLEGFESTLRSVLAQNNWHVAR